MYKLLTLTLLALVASGCAPEEKGRLEVENALEAYYSDFVYEMSLRGVNVANKPLELKYGPLEPRYLGTCRKGTTPQVIINDKHMFYDEEELRGVIYHELGHCLMGLGHDTRVDEYNRPLSIMFPFTFPFKGGLAKYLDGMIQ